MNDNKFLAQLNLYLDGEIDPAGAAALEQEILSNPARRRIYNDYCRVHRATQLVYQQFRAAADACGAEALPSSRSVIGRDLAAASNLAALGRTGGRAPSRPFRKFAFLGGIAAACGAGIFIATVAFPPDQAPATDPAPAFADTAPAPVVEKVAVATTVKDEPTTFAAPFAKEFRAGDPYLVRVSQSHADPFALTPWTNEIDATRLAPMTFSSAPILKVDPRFRPAAASFDPLSPGKRVNLPFRLRLNEQPASTPAYEFSVQQ
jgi:hypothetical protein